MAGFQFDEGNKDPWTTWEILQPSGDDPADCLFVMKSWILLILASLFEIAWAIGLKYTEGWTRFWPSLGTIVALVASAVLLGAAAKEIPMGTAYAVWTGIGAAGTVIGGILLLGEPATAVRLACVGLILAGVVGLKLT